jgi:hypothetical protein
MLSARAVPGSYKEDNWGNRASSVREAVKKRDSWKGAAIQREIERGSWRISTVRSHCQETADKDTGDWKGALCELWRLVVAL